MVLKIDLKVVLFIIAILLCGMLGSELSVTAQSAGETEIPLSLPQESLTETREPVPGGPGYVMVSPFSMIPRYDTYIWYFQGNSLISDDSYFNCPVNVPHGAIITKLVAYFYDGDSMRNMIVNLYQDDYINGNRTLMAQAVSFGSAGYIYATDPSIDYATVDLSSYAYSLQVHFPLGILMAGTFRGARVDYSYPAYLPTINN